MDDDGGGEAAAVLVLVGGGADDGRSGGMLLLGSSLGGSTELPGRRRGMENTQLKNDEIDSSRAHGRSPNCWESLRATEGLQIWN